MGLPNEIKICKMWKLKYSMTLKCHDKDLLVKVTYLDINYAAVKLLIYMWDIKD